MSKKDRIFVCPEFKKLIKISAAREGLSVIEYSKRLAQREGGQFEQKIRSVCKRDVKKKYDFF